MSPPENAPPPPTSPMRYKRKVYAGFIITAAEGVKWANRLRANQPGKRQITECRVDEARLLLTLDDRVKELGGIEVNLYGERDPAPDDTWDYLIVITQYGHGFFEWRDGKMQMVDSQKLVRGGYEDRAEELLQLEGVENYRFDTVFA